jgi:hypothetical protein
MDVESGTVVHAYGIVRTDAVLDLPTTGIGGAGVALLDAPPVSAVFSILPGASYGAFAWQDHAEDPAWLAGVATEHQRVLDDLVREADVLPLRLPAMYRDEVHLYEFLSSDAGLLESVLDTLHDHVEWSVHLYLVGQPEELVREPLAQEAYAALAELSRQSVVNRPQDSALTGRQEPMLLNSAHLICRRHERLFFAAAQETAEKLAPEGITVEVTGPWPPYNFVELGTDPPEAQP